VKEYEFTLKFALNAGSVDVDDWLELLAECGCDDAIVGVGRKGRLALSFARTASSAEEAVLSGITDVRRALPHAQLIEASPDFVGLTEVGELLGVSRQNVRKLIFDSDAPLPTPIHEGRPTIWHLAKVLHWLRREKGYSVDDELVALAETTLQVNVAVTQRDADAASQRQILTRLA
jgi:predicted DNA-binding transcriptional regulator AlpA